MPKHVGDDDRGGGISGDLQSMSFGSSDRSGSWTISTTSASCSSSSAAAADPGSDGDHISRRRCAPAAMSLSDLRFIRRLGSGDIGSVYLVEVKPKQQSDCVDGDGDEEGMKRAKIAAAKVMDKKELAARSKEGRAKTEREILEMVDHPFLPRLLGLAESERWSCLITEYCVGGDLHVLRQRQPHCRFPESAVRFYAAEVTVALEYLHMMGVVYRDLKPENVLVRTDGHIMLTDFDLSLKCDPSAPTPAHIISDPLITAPSVAAANQPPSSCILPSCIVPAVSCFHLLPRRRRRPPLPKIRRHASSIPEHVEFIAEPVELRSMSFVGTHEYLAPEIISAEGHGSSVDWWTLGIFIFELLYGYTPFRDHDHEMTMANIVARALEFPRDPPVSSAVKNLISSLLVKDPEERLGAKVGAVAVKRHPFFDGVTWALLRSGKPPFIPPPLPPVAAAVAPAGDNVEASEDDSSEGTLQEYY